MMEFLQRNYFIIEKNILQNLESSDIKHRTKDSSGLWLGPLIGLSMLITYLKEDNSYSEICLLLGISGLGLIISCICLYLRLSMNNASAKDFHVLYFLPAISLSTLYLLKVNKGLLVSVSWGLIVGSTSTWGVVQVLSDFPGCFTIGEATAVVHGIVLFLLSALTNLPLRYHLPPIHDSDIATVILQVGILYIMAFAAISAKVPKFREPILFYTLLVGVVIGCAIPTLYVILDQDPVIWILKFIFSSKSKICLFVYYSLCLICGFFAVLYETLKHSVASTTTRKIFHILGIMVYIPGIMWEPILLYLASGIVLVVFLFLEILRVFKLPIIGEFLQNGFTSFADEKDVLMSLSPLYLLCGLSAPLWFPVENTAFLPLMSGVLAIGIGDTAASIFGSKWGKNKWPESHRSIEGTAACIVSQLLTIVLFYNFGYFENIVLVRGVSAVIIVSLVEAKTKQIDNLALPFIMYLCLVF